MSSKYEILDCALLVLGRGEGLTLDAVAREVGLTKPGVVHHFPTKENLTLRVVDRLVDHWEAKLEERAGAASDAAERLRAYVEFALQSDFDASDLALFSDARLREKIVEQWLARLKPWLGNSITEDPAAAAYLQSARLLADGAWFNQAAGLVSMSQAERDRLLVVASGLIDQGLSS